MPFVPSLLPTKALTDAEDAIAYASRVRIYHRRRFARSAPQRITDIDLALARLREAMGPLRAEIGRFSYGPQTAIAEENRSKIREASAAIQRERRKLFKMKPKKAVQV